MNTERQFRYELKYHMNPADAELLRMTLGAVFVRDPHCPPRGGYKTRSLYFDTADAKNYSDKMDGLGERRKLRIRAYPPLGAGPIGADIVKLEIKEKVNDFSCKSTLSISREHALRIAGGDRDVLLSYEDEVAHRAYCLLSADYLRPVCIIVYEREAYYAPFDYIRITLDTSIGTVLWPADLFARNLPSVPVFDCGEHPVVLEVKCERSLPVWVRNIVSACRPMRVAMSKYCAGRMYDL